MSDSKIPFRVYLIVEYGWEHNDEYNYTPDGEPSHPIIAYLSEQRAKDDCASKNLLALRGIDLADYSSDGVDAYLSAESGQSAREEFIKWANATLGVTWDADGSECQTPKDLSLDKLKLLSEKFCLTFFAVISTVFAPDSSAIVPLAPEPKAVSATVEPEPIKSITLED